MEWIRVERFGPCRCTGLAVKQKLAFASRGERTMRGTRWVRRRREQSDLDSGQASRVLRIRRRRVMAGQVSSKAAPPSATNDR